MFFQHQDFFLCYGKILLIKKHTYHLFTNGKGLKDTLQFVYCVVCISKVKMIESTEDRTAGEGDGHFFNSSLPPPPDSQTPRHWPGECCKELISAHSQQPDSNRESLVSEPKSLTTKLRALLTRVNSKPELFVLLITN